ncbi:unnamed protein product [Mytilus coruscus]|uniref:DDE Tnp4 domain-containing protein n=1 Tax=Mytilus coruscus TaxID=42192 RepID=A0A6J8BY83_MYTCO|nr:unnamed protein product [Mytilus coruscus]
MANQLLFGNVFALRKQRVYRDRIELATLSDRQIRSRFRFKRESIQFISDLLRNDLSQPQEGVSQFQLKCRRDQFIKWPARQEERDRNKQGFFRGGLFPGVIGCIDGTHVKIQAPSEDEPAYVNRKGWHSINVQGVCDHEGRFHVLHGEVRMKPAKVCRIIGACAILHNIAIMLREPMEDDESGENQEDVGQMNYNGPEDGRTIRNFITTSYF